MLVNPYQQYQNNSVMTASPGELTLMLYNGAIKFINQGIEAISAKEVQKAHTYIIKAQNIIDELLATLDMKYEIASQLSSLYSFIKELLVEGNIYKDINKLEDARDMVRDFRDMWQEVLKAAK